ncbi:MAG: dienelactone hydrolase family protein [Thermostichales cyanobacterium SZTDM-1c_bins_54]
MSGSLGRRQFMVSSVAAGFALAVQPISAQTIITPAEGLTAGFVEIPSFDRPIPAYRALPAQAQDPLPMVLVIQEIFGVHAHIQDICRRLAQLGYLAIAPELFVRQGDVSQLSSFEAIRPIVAQVPDAQVFRDLDAALLWGQENGGDPGRAGVTGFCWGGRITWLYAAHNPQLRAGVAWYGRLVGEVTPLTPQHPVDIAPQLTVPVLGLYGGQDQGIPLDTVGQMRQALGQGTSASEIVVYPDAPHAFYADYRPSYRAAEAADAWNRMLAWFKTYGVS